MIVTIDGDGCWNPKWMKNIYQIVASHPDIKFTGSLITAYYDGTLRESMAETITEIAKQIFALPNIEVATHSHTHPNDWEVQDARNLTSTPWTVEEEIEKSQKIIKDITGKTAEIFLLTGSCNPNGKQVETIYRHGLTPFNGGIEKPTPFRLIGGYRVYNQRGHPDVHFHGIRKHQDGVAYLDEPDGYRNAVHWFNENPERPIHVYFHFYVGEFPETIEAVNHVLDWCKTQEIESLYLSEYLKRLWVE